jgi:MoaA/NifB/PqqE/SkfB family radical SAM enzyme
MCSIDGTDDVIEYQRRGAKWATVSDVSCRISHHEFIGSVVNYTLTAVNALNIPKFVEWVDQNKINGVCVTPVFREDYMSVAALPPALMETLIDKLEQQLTLYKTSTANWTQKNTVELVETFLRILRTTVHQPDYIRKLKYKIMIENKASSKKFLDIVPEWGPYFDAVKPPWLK